MRLGGSLSEQDAEILEQAAGLALQVPRPVKSSDVFGNQVPRQIFSA